MARVERKGIDHMRRNVEVQSVNPLGRDESVDKLFRRGKEDHDRLLAKILSSLPRRSEWLVNEFRAISLNDPDPER